MKSLDNVNPVDQGKISKTVEMAESLLEDAEDFFDEVDGYVKSSFKSKTIRQINKRLDDIFYIIELLGYWFNDFIQQPGSSALFLIALILIGVFVGGLLLSISHHEAAAGDILFLAWEMIVDPSTQFNEYYSGPLPFYISVLIAIYGLVVMVCNLHKIYFEGLLVGFLTETVVSGMQSLRKGNGKIVERNHYLILGWNQKLLDVIRNCSKSAASAKRIVILANRDKEFMDNALKNITLSKTNKIKVITKSGDPTNSLELRNVSVSRAKVVIILSDDDLGNGADCNTIMKTVLVLGTPKLKAYVVAEIKTKSKFEAIKRIGGNRVVPVFSPDSIGRFICQCGRQQGLSEVIYDIFDFDGSDVYFKYWPHLVGKNFIEAAYYLDDNAVLCGVLKASKEEVISSVFELNDADSLLINPPNDYQLKEGEKLMVISEDFKTYRFRTTPLLSPSSRPVLPQVNYTTTDDSLKEVLIIGWREDMNRVIEEMLPSLSSKSAIIFLNKNSISERDLDESLFTRETTFKHIVADASIPSTLGPFLEREPPLKTIYVFRDKFSDSCLADDEVSVITLSICQIIQDYKSKKRRQSARLEDATHSEKPLILSEMNDPDKVDMVSRFQEYKCEWVVGNKFIGTLIANLAIDYNNRLVADEILNAGGNDAVLVDHKVYVETGQPVAFIDLWLKGRQMDPPEIVIGYKLKDKKALLNPKNKFRKRKFKTGDKIIVIKRM